LPTFPRRFDAGLFDVDHWRRELDDGPAAAEENLMHATLHDRVLPGDGDFDLRGIVGALRDIGSTAPSGVEVFSGELHALGPDCGPRAADSTRRVVASV
jgi:sugar phosphate isomerase/epimerase